MRQCSGMSLEGELACRHLRRQPHTREDLLGRRDYSPECLGGRCIDADGEGMRPRAAAAQACEVEPDRLASTRAELVVVVRSTNHEVGKAGTRAARVFTRRCSRKVDVQLFARRPCAIRRVAGAETTKLELPRSRSIKAAGVRPTCGSTTP